MYFVCVNDPGAVDIEAQSLKQEGVIQRHGAVHTDELIKTIPR